MLPRFLLLLELLRRGPLASGELLASCGPAGEVSLATQADVDELVALGCEELGTLRVTGDVLHLRNLSGLKRLSAALQIDATTELVDLQGLESLTAVGGSAEQGNASIDIRGNEALQSIEALENLRGALTGCLRIEGNPALTSLRGLDGLTSLGCCLDHRALSVQRNHALESLDGLDSVASLAGCGIEIQRNMELRDTSALGNIVGPLAILKINNNPSLTSLYGFHGIIGASSVQISANSALRSLEDLEKFTFIEDLEVRANPRLETLRGLHSLSRCDRILVVDNDRLATLAAFGRVTAVQRGVIIEGNAALQNLSDLESVTSLGGTDAALSLKFNGALRSIAALGSLRGRQAGALYIEHNLALTSLHGLEGTTLWTSISVSDNRDLQSVAALGNVKGTIHHAYIRRNRALKSLQGLRGIRSRETCVVHSYLERLCFPSSDHLPEDAGSPLSQPWAAWNASDCHQCPSDCSLPGTDFVECDYGSGRCRCPVGLTGPGCVDPTPRFHVVEGQAFECQRGRVGQDCTLRVQLCLKGPAPRQGFNGSAVAESLRLYDTCEGSATSPACTRGEADFAAPQHAATWEWSAEGGEGGTCGFLVAPIRVDEGDIFEPEKVAKLRVGYSSRQPPGFVLDGTVADPAVTQAPLIYPWCLDSGDCVQQAPALISATIEGREVQCSAGSFARQGRPKCEECGDGKVSEQNTIIAVSESAEHACIMCSRWEKPSPGRDQCEVIWPMILGLLAGGVFLALGLHDIIAELQFVCVCSTRSLWGLSSRRVLIQDISKEKESVIVTTAGHHGFRAGAGSIFQVIIEQTENPALDRRRLRAKCLGIDRLQLFDDAGKPLQGHFDTSMGTIRLPPERLLMNTGWKIPKGFVSPHLVLAGVASLCVVGQNYYARDLSAVFAASAVVVALASPRFWGLHAPKTALQQRLALYAARLLEESSGGAGPTPCDRGPGRAVEVGKILDLWEFFHTFVQDRSMYYLDSNIVRPITAPHQLSFAEVVGPSQVQWFVSHFWGHPFQQTCAALRRHAQAMTDGCHDWHKVAYWLCTLSNNQFRVTSELGEGRWDQSSFYLALKSPQCQGTCMVLDEKALPLDRSWCLFEVLHTLRRVEKGGSDGFCGLLFCTSSGVMNRGEAGLEVSLNLAKRVTSLRLQDATATSLEDKHMIDSLVDSEMGGFDAINRRLKMHIQRALDTAKTAMIKEFSEVSKELSSCSARP